MKLELRPYQSAAVSATRQAIADCFAQGIDHPRIFVNMPTGSGKTVVAIDMLKRALERTDANVVWLTHRIELVDQAVARFEQFGLPRDRCKVWSVGKAWNRAKDAKKWTEFLKAEGIDTTSILLVDEAHHSAARTWAGIIEKFPGYVIGMSATCYRLTKYEGFDHIFDSLVVGPTLEELIDSKYLCPIRQWTVPVVYGVDGGTGGDFKIGATVDQAIKTHTNEAAVEWISGFCKNQVFGDYRMVVFVMSVQHARVVTELLKKHGLKADYIANQAEMPADHRAQVVERFRTGELDTLCNVNVLTEGFDLSDANVVAILRPTKSLSLYLQMVGRATRIDEGKQCCYILDATDTSTRFGTAIEADKDQDWSLKPRGEKGDGKAPCKVCPNCDCLNHAAAVQCMECGHDLMRPCASCGKNTNTEKLEPYQDKGIICPDCRADHRRRFEDAYELKHYTNLNGWKQSQKGNFTRTRSKDSVEYRLVVVESSRGGYGYLGFLAAIKDGYKLFSGWGFKTPEAACKACDKHFKEKFLTSIRHKSIRIRLGAG